MSQSTTAKGAPDVINRLAGITDGSPLAELRAQRPEVARHAQGTFEALLEPDDPVGVSRREREMIALRVAVLTKTEPLVAFHRTRLQELGTNDATIDAIERFPDVPAATPREDALLRHVDLLTREPSAASEEELAHLIAIGFSPRDLVTIAQLIAYINFEVRVLAGLRLLAEVQ